MPGRKPIGFNDVAGVKCLDWWALDNGLGVQHHHMMKVRMLLGAAHDFKLCKRFAKNSLMPSSLINGRWNSIGFVAVFCCELTMRIDDKVGLVVLWL